MFNVLKRHCTLTRVQYGLVDTRRTFVFEGLKTIVQAGPARTPVPETKPASRQHEQQNEQTTKNPSKDRQHNKPKRLDEDAVHKRIQELTSYTFKDLSWLSAALSSQKPKKKIPFQDQEVKRLQRQLAFLGESTLRQVYFTRSFPFTGRITWKGDHLEGLEGPVDNIASAKALRVVAESNGLRKLIPDHVAKARNIGWMMQGIVGAVWMDSGKDFEVTEKAVEGLVSRSSSERGTGRVLERKVVEHRGPWGKNAKKTVRRQRRQMVEGGVDGGGTTLFPQEGTIIGGVVMSGEY